MKKSFIVIILLLIFIVGCNGDKIDNGSDFTCSKPFIKTGSECCLDENDDSICDYARTSKTLDEWEDLMNDDMGSVIEECNDKAAEMMADCIMHDGWSYSNMIAVADFDTDESDDFQTILNDGCSMPEDTYKYPVTVTTFSFDSATEGRFSYQYICKIDCLTWNCPGEKVDKVALLDVNDLDCPTIPGWMKGDLYSNFKNARTVHQPSLINAWGREAGLSCKYYKDSGEREWSQYGEGDIIYDSTGLSLDFQVDGSFEDRPGWGQELYCQGGSNPRGAHIDHYSSNYVAKVTYPTITAYSEDVQDLMESVSEKLLDEIETGYAIECP
ncbi:hypothetical protein ACFL1H_08215 [Nanoarchaeota archaeon]